MHPRVLKRGVRKRRFFCRLFFRRKEKSENGLNGLPLCSHKSQQKAQRTLFPLRPPQTKRKTTNPTFPHPRNPLLAKPPSKHSKDPFPHRKSSLAVPNRVFDTVPATRKAFGDSKEPFPEKVLWQSARQGLAPPSSEREAEPRNPPSEREAEPRNLPRRSARRSLASP